MRGHFAAIAIVAVGCLFAERFQHASRSLPPTDLIDTGPSSSNDATRPSVHRFSDPVSIDNDPLIPPIEVAAVSMPYLPVSPTNFDVGSHATFHPHGEQVCSSGCAASRHPTVDLSRDKFASLIRSYANEPIVEAGPALDELLYFGRQAAQLLSHTDRNKLDPLRYAILKTELARDHAIVEIRVVDSDERVRATLPPTKVPLDRRHEFELQTSNLQPMIASGTVKRVARDYAWTRL